MTDSLEDRVRTLEANMFRHNHRTKGDSGQAERLASIEALLQEHTELLERIARHVGA